ncbi:hypothetical protein A7E78_03455 [Syntrophotalea acetylenivorans]|uniref:Uncharacterized protein n=1 Tax=Syntrophotalea acetylenivorans TaxID=1842532 RepID=A0A1L3GM49_9BACT|nr:type II and III secretion system protein family protein [Syntrophotalea acetylenivorans]APG26970.1 hypothetical protein A7E78_03455 [Syntrophotalea acetylenivorans]
MRKFRLIAKPMRLAAGLALLLFAAPLFAAEIEHLTLDVNVGGSELVKIAEPSRRMKILISNQDIIGARPLKADLINVYNLGKKVGYSRVTVWDDYKREVRAIIDVNVSLDVTPLKQKLHQLYPNQDIKVYSSESGIVLSGSVSGPEVMEQTLRLARTFLPPKAEGDRSEEDTGKSGDGITNLMRVSGIQQVMLEVKFAEVTRSSSRDLRAAFGWDGLIGDDIAVGGIGGLATNSNGTLSGATPGSLLLNFANFGGDIPANIFVEIGDFSAALRFLEEEGLARLLAEPRLVTQSGQEASFLAGGEFPIPVPDDDGITIEYKEFGVALRFTPVVLSNGKISLRVAPSVSDIASSSTIPTGTITDFVVPNLITRKLESTVQLYDGQTLALAGLLQDSLRESVSKIPGLGDIPIIGTLFRSTSYQQERTDLMISVTPHLVTANKEGTIKYPGQDMKIPNRYEFYLEGRLEGRRSGDMDTLGVHSFGQEVPESEQGGLEGSFGHEPVTAE